MRTEDFMDLQPAESIALTVARAQVERGENPGLNTTAVLLLIIDRLLAASREAVAE